MSLKKIEDYLLKIEAIRNYDKVSIAYEGLSKEYKRMKLKYEQETRMLRSEISELNNLRSKYGKKEYGLRNFNVLVKEESRKWKDSILDKMLDEKWKKEKDVLLMKKYREELNSYPTGCARELVDLIESRTQQEVEKKLRKRVSWPTWFKKIYQSEVRNGVAKGLNEEFEKRVKEGSEERLDELVQTEWPKFVEEKITPFCRREITSQLMEISRPMRLWCDKCGTSEDLTIGSGDIAKLIKWPRIFVFCPNPNCKTILGRRRIWITLGQIIDDIVKTPVFYGRAAKD